MAKSGGRGIVWLIVAMIVAALAYRFWPRGSRTIESTDSAIPIVSTPDATGARVLADAREVDAPDERSPQTAARFQPDDWRVSAISTAGDKALLYRDDKAPGDIPAFRVVVIATAIVEAEVVLTSRKFIGIDDPTPPGTEAEQLEAHAKDYAKVWPLLREFPLGAGERTATAGDGKSGAFNFGDLLYVVADKPIKVPLPAAYDPRILPDGKTVVFRGFDGEFDGPGTGRYSLFTMSLAGGKVRKVAGTEGADGVWAMSRDGKFLRVVIGALPWVQACVVEIPLVAPLKIARKRCIDGDQLAQLSRHGERVIWSVPLDAEVDSTIGRPRRAAARVRALELANGSVPFDHMTFGSFLVSDGGRILLEDAETAYAIAGTTTREIELDGVTLYCKFLDDTSVVCPDRETVKRIDLTTLQ